MSLELLKQTTPISYQLWQTGDSTAYNPSLLVPPRVYKEQISHTSAGLDSFFYDSQRDRYVVVAIMDITAWPSHSVQAFVIHPETGLQESRQDITGAFSVAFDRYIENGDLKKIYSNRFAGTSVNTIITVNPSTYEPNPSDVIVSSADVGGAQIQRFLLNRTDGIVAISATSKVLRFHYPTQTPLSSIAMPEGTIIDLAYEDKDRGWSLMNNATYGLSAVKFNYTSARVESYTKLQSGSGDLAFQLAYDSRRKNLAVFRQRNEDSTGQATHLLDIYKPIVKPTNITDPVPLQPMIPGTVVTMVAHLIGDRGEAGAIKPVTITNSGDGTILQSVVTPRSNGVISFQYLVGSAASSDTITLEATV